MNSNELIDFFNMRPLPGEGGYYVESYRATEKFSGASLPGRYEGERDFSTAILYLVTRDSFSRLHRVKSDEMFHFYLGDAVRMLQLKEDGSSEQIVLGRDILAGQRLQVTVPRGVWQGCVLEDGGSWALIGCTVSPGFEFCDYESGQRQRLLERYPDQQEMIISLTDRT